MCADRGNGRLATDWALVKSQRGASGGEAEAWRAVPEPFHRTEQIARKLKACAATVRTGLLNALESCALRRTKLSSHRPNSQETQQLPITSFLHLLQRFHRRALVVTHLQGVP